MAYSHFMWPGPGPLQGIELVQYKTMGPGSCPVQTFLQNLLSPVNPSPCPIPVQCKCAITLLLQFVQMSTRRRKESRDTFIYFKTVITDPSHDS